MKKAGRLSSLFAAGAALFMVGGTAVAQSAPYGPPAPPESETTETLDFKTERYETIENIFRSKSERPSVDSEDIYRLMADQGYVEYFPDTDTFDRQWVNERSLDRFMRQNHRRVALNDRINEIDQLNFHSDIPSINDVEDFETRYLDRDDMPHIFGAVCVPYDERFSTVCMKSMNNGRGSLDFFYDNREVHFPNFGNFGSADGSALSLTRDDRIERNVQTYGVRYSIRFK